MKKVLFTATVDSHIIHFHLLFLKLFKDNGYEVHVATNGDAEIPYCDVKHKIPFARSPFSIDNLKAIKQLKKIVDEQKFEIIHTHTPMGSVVTRLAAKKARKNGTRVIYTAHGFHFYTGAPLINWMLYYPVEKYLAKYTDTLITINTEDYERAKKKFSKRCKDIQYVPGVGVDPKKFDIKMTKKEKSELRKSLGLKDDDFVLIYVAELNKNKNQSMAIKAMKELVKENSNIKLLLVGKGILEEKYKDMVNNLHLENNVIFTGYRKDVPQLMHISNLAISCSKREGLPVNLIEAQICGLPIVATDCRGNRDVIKNKEFILKTFEYKELSIYLEKIIKNYNLINIKNIDMRYLNQNIIKNFNKIYFFTGLKNDKFKKESNISKRNILFSHDCFLSFDSNLRFFSCGNIGGKIFLERYMLNNNDTMNYFTRTRLIDNIDENGYAQLDRHREEVLGSYIYKKPLDFFLKQSDIRKECKNILKKIDYCIVRLPSVLGIIAFNEAIKMKIPTVVELVGCPFRSLIYYGNIKGYMFAPVMYILTKKAVKKADYVHYVTKQYLQKKYPSKGKNILACSDVSLSNLSDDIILKRLEKLEETKKSKKIIMGIVGSLDVDYKGHKICFKALKQLRKEYNVELHLVGGGDTKRWIKLAKKYKIEENIVFDGILKNGNDMYKWYDKIDILLMMSKTEGLPRTIIEAMSRGCIIIASNVGGIPELIDKKELLYCNDLKGLIKKIEFIISNSKIQEQICINNFEKSKEFSNENLMSKRKDFYTNFLNNITK